MFPYLIAGAIGFVVAKIFDEDEAPKYDDGGSVLLAPNGKPSNLTSQQYELVRTKAFISWFGDWENSPETASKVIDENGEPLVVYHGYLVGGGAGRKFYEFKKLPAFFSKTKKFAYEYASTKSMDGGIDADIDTYACFLNIRKLFDSENKENIKLAEEQLPEKIRVSHGTAWFLSADIPKEEVIEQMMGIITIQTDDLLVKDILSSNVGDIIAEKVSASQYENKILFYKDEDWAYITDERNFNEVVNEEIAEWVNNDYEKTIKYKGKYLKTFILIEGTYKLELNKDPLFLEFQNEVEKRKKYYIDNILNLLKQYGKTIKTKNGNPYRDYFYVRKINLKTYKTTTKNNWTMFENETLQKFLIDNNFGGWCALETGDKTYGVYNANQIKLSDGSNTTFDGNNPDIRYNDGGKLADNIFYYFKEKGLTPLGNQFWGKSNCTIKIDFSNVLYQQNGDNRVWVSPIEYSDYKKAFTILEFHCKDKNKGIGTAVLKEIIQGADLFGYTIFIEPTNMKKYRVETDINTNDLKEWYSKYDFKPLNDNYSDYVWLRNPKNSDISFMAGGDTKKIKNEKYNVFREEYFKHLIAGQLGNIKSFSEKNGNKNINNLAIKLSLLHQQHKAYLQGGDIINELYLLAKKIDENTGLKTSKGITYNSIIKRDIFFLKETHDKIDEEAIPIFNENNPDIRYAGGGKIEELKFSNKIESDAMGYDIGDYLYHITPVSNFNTIINKGFIPKNGISINNKPFENRLYFATSLISAYDLSVNFGSYRDDSEYVIFKIKSDCINDYEEDGLFAHGIYVDYKVSNKCIVGYVNENDLFNKFDDEDLENLYY